MDGRSALRYAINVTSFGMGGEVAAKANKSSKALGGKAAFLAATLTTAVRYSGRNVRLVLDGSTTFEANITNVAVGNGQYHGGGMWVCPRASMEDGLLDVTAIRRLQLHELLRNLPLLYNGRIYEHSKVSFHRARQINATSIETTLIEIDGEPLGKLPVGISVIPKRIRVLVS
jgi:diacylglycerol kinase family enzyme